VKLAAIALAAAILGHGAHAAAEPGRLGVMVDAGVPDGLTGSLVYRPIDMIRLHGGGGTNLISPGVRAGIAVIPLPFAVSPSLNVELGHYFAGDANRTARAFGAGDPEAPDSPLLREVGYDYANLHLGLEIGRSRFSFYLHAGFSAVRGQLRNLGEELSGDEAASMEADPRIELRDDPIFTLWTPSARLGAIFFF
jgi:hypothetical protein